MNNFELALKALTEITELTGEDENGCLNEWTEAEAFNKAQNIAKDALETIRQMQIPL